MKRFTPPQERRIKVQRLGSRGINPMESMAKGKSAKWLTPNLEPYNPDRNDVQLICNHAGYKGLQSFI